MPTDTVSIAEFVKANHIGSSAVRVDTNPNMEESGRMDHWKVTLRKGFSGHRQKRSMMTVYFSQGYAHNGKEPKVESVLSCLASDSASVSGNDFEMWCNDLGYDSDSRKAERIFQVCEHQAKRLRNFLDDDDLYEQLLWHTEAL